MTDGHDRPVNGHAGLPAIGSHGGAEHVTLTLSQMPPHSHRVTADTANRTTGSMPNTIRNSIPSTVQKPQNASSTAPAPAAPAIYGPAKSGSLQALAAQGVKTAGSGAGHENRQPFLPLVYCIAISGLYPPRA